MLDDRGPMFNVGKFWFCQLPSASYSQIFKALWILSARFSEANEVIWLVRIKLTGVRKTLSKWYKALWSKFGKRRRASGSLLFVKKCVKKSGVGCCQQKRQRGLNSIDQKVSGGSAVSPPVFDKTLLHCINSSVIECRFYWPKSQLLTQ